jgi:L-alanine-DL-glutamate epimerase-like enolase superfamily enzyme
MKITGADIFFAPDDGIPQPAKTNLLLIRVNTDEGICGYGEAISYGQGINAAHTSLQDYARLILGQDPFDTEKIWAKLHDGWNILGGPISVSAISAIDIALWDIKGKALGQPVYKLLGGKFRDKIRAYLSHIEFGYPTPRKVLNTPDDYYECVQAAKTAGYDVIKANFIRVSLGRRSFDESINKFINPDLLECIRAKVEASRKALGPDGGIILENNAMTGVEGAIQIARAVEEFNILFFEEPIEPTNPQAMKQVADKVAFPLASGERMCTRWSFLPFLENGSLRIIQPDICNTGGITEMKKIADLAAAYHVLVAPHVCGGPFNHAAAVQLEASIPNFVIHEDHVRLKNEEYTRYGVYRYEAKDGYLPIPDLPGIGQELSEYGEKTLQKTTIKESR